MTDRSTQFESRLVFFNLNPRHQGVVFNEDFAKSFSCVLLFNPCEKIIQCSVTTELVDVVIRGIFLAPFKLVND